MLTSVASHIPLCWLYSSLARFVCVVAPCNEGRMRVSLHAIAVGFKGMFQHLLRGLDMHALWIRFWLLWLLPLLEHLSSKRCSGFLNLYGPLKKIGRCKLGFSSPAFLLRPHTVIQWTLSFVHSRDFLFPLGVMSGFHNNKKNGQKTKTIVFIRALRKSRPQ